jgi:hypothetical protein
MGRLPQKAETHPRQINNENYRRAATAVEPTTKSSLFEVPSSVPSERPQVERDGRLRPARKYPTKTRGKSRCTCKVGARLGVKKCDVGGGVQDFDAIKLTKFAAS